jgi:hypothetical protein
MCVVPVTEWYRKLYVYAPRQVDTLVVNVSTLTRLQAGHACEEGGTLVVLTHALSDDELHVNHFVGLWHSTMSMECPDWGHVF